MNGITRIVLVLLACVLVTYRTPFIDRSAPSVDYIVHTLAIDVAIVLLVAFMVSL